MRIAVKVVDSYNFTVVPPRLNVSGENPVTPRAQFPSPSPGGSTPSFSTCAGLPTASPTHRMA